MNQTLHDTTKKTADALIDMGIKFADKLDKWSNIVVGEGSLQNTERAGFVNKTSASSGIDLVIDIHALNDGKEAALRTWALDSSVGDDGAKIFNNIQLTFTVAYEKARALTERFDMVTWDDIRDLLHEQNTVLQELVLCNKSGLSETEQIIPGRYYDVSADEIVEQNITEEVCNTLTTVLETLQHTADTETA